MEYNKELEQAAETLLSIKNNFKVFDGIKVTVDMYVGDNDGNIIYPKAKVVASTEGLVNPMSMHNIYCTWFGDGLSTKELNVTNEGIKDFLQKLLGGGKHYLLVTLSERLDAIKKVLQETEDDSWLDKEVTIVSLKDATKFVSEMEAYVKGIMSIKGCTKPLSWLDDPKRTKEEIVAAMPSEDDIEDQVEALKKRHKIKDITSTSSAVVTQMYNGKLLAHRSGVECYSMKSLAKKQTIKEAGYTSLSAIEEAAKIHDRLGALGKSIIPIFRKNGWDVYWSIVGDDREVSEKLYDIVVSYTGRYTAEPLVREQYTVSHWRDTGGCPWTVIPILDPIDNTLGIKYKGKSEDVSNKKP